MKREQTIYGLLHDVVRKYPNDRAVRRLAIAYSRIMTRNEIDEATKNCRPKYRKAGMNRYQATYHIITGTECKR